MVMRIIAKIVEQDPILNAFLSIFFTNEISVCSPIRKKAKIWPSAETTSRQTNPLRGKINSLNFSNWLRLEEPTTKPP